MHPEFEQVARFAALLPEESQRGSLYSVLRKFAESCSVSGLYFACKLVRTARRETRGRSGIEGRGGEGGCEGAPSIPRPHSSGPGEEGTPSQSQHRGKTPLVAGMCCPLPTTTRLSLPLPVCPGAVPQDGMLSIASDLGRIEGLSLRDQYSFCMAPLKLTDADARIKLVSNARWIASSDVPLFSSLTPRFFFKTLAPSFIACSVLKNYIKIFLAADELRGDIRPGGAGSLRRQLPCHCPGFASRAARPRGPLSHRVPLDLALVQASSWPHVSAVGVFQG